MDATLIIASLTKAYSDAPSTQAPIMESANWTQQLSVPVSNAKTEPYKIAPGVTFAVFSGTVATLLDNTTVLTLALSPLASNRYRFTATAGTLPAFRTARALTLATQSVAVVVNANQTATMTAAAASFSAVQVGDNLFIPGTSTGDAAGPFSVINEGVWLVLSVAGDGSSVQLGRLTGMAFAGLTETKVVASNPQVIAYSSTGVQVGNSVSILLGFAAAVLGSYAIQAVTPTWFEVVTTAALPVSAVGTPTIAGIMFYTVAKRYLRVLADQNCDVQVNGNLSGSDGLVPWSAGDLTQMADFVKTGPSWSLSIKNTSPYTVNVAVISAE